MRLLFVKVSLYSTDIGAGTGGLAVLYGQFLLKSLKRNLSVEEHNIVAAGEEAYWIGSVVIQTEESRTSTPRGVVVVVHSLICLFVCL